MAFLCKLPFRFLDGGKANGYAQVFKQDLGHCAQKQHSGIIKIKKESLFKQPSQLSLCIFSLKSHIFQNPLGNRLAFKNCVY